MSDMPQLAGRVARKVLNEGWALGGTVLAFTAAGLLVTHLTRAADAGLLHWPWRPGRPLRIGPPPSASLTPVPPATAGTVIGQVPLK